MINKQDVLMGLVCCSESSGYGCNWCPYGGECRETTLSGCKHLCADALELLEEQPQWISVEDRLPPDDEMVIGYIPIDRHMFVGLYKTYQHSWMEAPIGYWLILTADGSTEQITKKVSHWMPLPKGVE